MSLQKLSTELDGQIASSLLGDTKALSAFSKTNKYYRGIAEPYLFKNIEVAANDVETSLRLLFTLLDRKELALYIGSLTYTQPVRRQEVTNRSLKQEKLRSDVWKYKTAIQDRMDEVLFPVSAVQKMVNNPAMSNLRELVVVGCGKGRRWQPDGIQEDGLVELLRSLEKHTPLLELLQWSHQESNRPEGHPQFDTFRDIKHLRKLHVDFGLLVPHKDTKLKCLSDPHAVIPAHLEHLTLDCFNTDKLHKLVSTFNETVEKAEDMSETEALQANLTILVALFSPLRHLSLIVPMETRNESMNTVTLHELDPVDIVFFRYAADELHKLGVTLEVFSRKGGYEKEKKLLVKKGWTASLPQYLE
ncbi:hypothetical protein J4E90_006882 [Alternaria incomplexa]|uniref:uncharacterized protein n=1 Tax=Alternaria incomplexa TaxID=1187928 RepID=UPI00221E8E9F|nr:uncharacterized protein J4E90_006882 [Alternaria incomplexa]KAI4912062.1 hypothetical protein J4E90_006882 [Alternaria incomplexa]